MTPSCQKQSNQAPTWTGRGHARSRNVSPKISAGRVPCLARTERCRAGLKGRGEHLRRGRELPDLRVTEFVKDIPRMIRATGRIDDPHAFQQSELRIPPGLRRDELQVARRRDCLHVTPHLAKGRGQVVDTLLRVVDVMELRLVVFGPYASQVRDFHGHAGDRGTAGRRVPCQHGPAQLDLRARREAQVIAEPAPRIQRRELVLPRNGPAKPDRCIMRQGATPGNEKRHRDRDHRHDHLHDNLRDNNRGRARNGPGKALMGHLRRTGWLTSRTNRIPWNCDLRPGARQRR